MEGAAIAAARAPVATTLERPHEVSHISLKAATDSKAAWMGGQGESSQGSQ